MPQTSAQPAAQTPPCLSQTIEASFRMVPGILPNQLASLSVGQTCIETVDAGPTCYYQFMIRVLTLAASEGLVLTLE